MRLLAAVARRLRAAVLCTIHQPSSEVFANFDQTLVLSGGRTAYCGPAAELARHLAGIGKPVPDNTNPADFVLDVVNSDFVPQEAVEEVLRSWQVGGARRLLERARALPGPLPRGRRASGSARQLAVLLRRQVALAGKDPSLYGSRVAACAAMSGFLCVLFVYSRGKAQDYVLRHFFLAVFVLLCVALLSLAAVFADFMEARAARREVVAGLYTWGTYAAAKTLVQVPMMGVLAATTMLPWWAILDWHWGSFGLCWVVLSVFVLSFDCAAQLCSLDANLLRGIGAYQTLWFFSFVFSGVFGVQRGDVIWPFRVLCYVLPTLWGLRSFMFAALPEDAQPFGGVLPCDADLATCPRGFFCPDHSPVSCFGDTGPRVLESVSRVYTAFSPEDTVASDLAILVAIGAAFKLGYLLVLRHQCSQVVELGELTEEQEKESVDASTQESGGRPSSSGRTRAATVSRQLYEDGWARAVLEEGAAPLEPVLWPVPSLNRQLSTQEPARLRSCSSFRYNPLYISSSGDSGQMRTAGEGADSSGRSGGAGSPAGEGPRARSPSTTQQSQYLLRLRSKGGSAREEGGQGSSPRSGAGGGEAGRRSEDSMHTAEPSPAAAADVDDGDVEGEFLDALGEIEFTAKLCSFSVPIRSRCPGCGAGGPRKVLVDKVSASVRAGEVVAIMGPSGAGKTTLLKMLTLQRMAGAASGEVTLNGRPFTAALYSSACAMVQQEDALWPHLTCREHILYAVALCQAREDQAGRAGMVARLLGDLGLESCQDARAGGPLLKGLSGGQKRRLSLGVALTKRPTVVFLDEPTSGLDAAGAAAVMRLLAAVAVSQQSCILCTIHQPSSSVFAGLDQTLILSGGRTAYCGAAVDMVEYLASIGRPVPPATNPADFILQIVNADFVDRAQVAEVLQAWQAANQTSEGLPPPPGTPIPEHRAPGFLAQLAVLTRKHLLLTWRDPIMYMSRLGVLTVISVLFCVLYIDTRRRTQEQLFPRFFLQWWLSNIAPSLSILPLIAQHYELPALLREMSDGMYHPAAYILASTFIQAPMVGLFTLCNLLPAYAIADWHWSSLGRNVAVNASTLMAFECLAQFCSMDPHPVLGLLSFIMVWFTGMLTSGFILAAKDLIWPFRVLTWALPLRWSVEGSAYALWHATPAYGGTAPCEALPDGTCPRGFYCPGYLGLCYGATGDHILESFAANYEVFNTADRLGQCCGNILIFAAVFKVLYAWRMMRAVRGADGILPEASVAKAEAADPSAITINV